MMSLNDTKITSDVDERIAKLRKLASQYENVQDFGNNEPDAIDEWNELQRLTGESILL